MPGMEDEIRNLCQELDRAIRRREPRRVEDCLTSHDISQIDTDLLLELIYTEFVARCETGEQPDPTEYIQRFPHIEDDLEELFFVHQIVRASLHESEGAWKAAAAAVSDGIDAPSLPAGKGETGGTREGVPSAPNCLAEGNREASSARASLAEGAVEEEEVQDGMSLPPGAVFSGLCDDASSRGETQTLADSHITAGATPTAGSGSVGPRSPDATKANGGTILGHYELLEEIGRGATAVVYKARDLHLKRCVALKVINQTSWDPAARQRLMEEAQAAASLRHPHIVHIYEVGETDDCCYVAMEYLEGGSLADRPEKLWSPREAARLVEQLARAVHFAHEHQILHRDLKPANVLLDGDGTPKIVDFGLAKRLDETSPTASQEDLVGTPSYMAPEQTLGGKRVGPAADVYALGAILYELLTGRPPFAGRNALETLLQVRNQEPVTPSRHRPSIHRDLVTICLKCLEKSPERRYASAAALAEDLNRFLEGHVILARPAGPGERLLKWTQRHRAAVAAIVAVLLLLGITIWGLRWYSARLAKIEADRLALAQLAEKQAQELRSQEDVSRQQRYLEALTRAQELMTDNSAQALAVLEDPDRCPKELRGFAWHLLYNLCTEGRISWTVASRQEEWVRRLAASSDGRYLFWGTWCGAVLLWDLPGQHLVEDFPAHSDWISALAVCRRAGTSPDGSASSAPTPETSSTDEQIVATASLDHTIRLWRWQPAASESRVRLIREFRLGSNDVAWDLAFHPRQPILAAASDRGIALFPLDDGEPLQAVLANLSKAARQGEETRAGQETQLGEGAYAGEGTGVAAGTRAGEGTRVSTVKSAGSGTNGDGRGRAVWLVPPPLIGGEKKVLSHRSNGPFGGGTMFRSVAFSPRGDLLAAGSLNGRVVILSWPAAQVTLQVREFQDPVWSLDFSPDGTLLAAAAAGNVWLYNFASKQSRYLRDVHFHPIHTVQFSPDARRLLTTADDYTARVWEVKSLSQTHRLTAHEGYDVYGMFSLDGRTVYTASQGTLNAWDLEERDVPVRLENENRPVQAFAWSPQGDRIATAEGTSGRDTAISLWDLAGKNRVVSAKQNGLSEDWLFFTPDGKWLITVVRGRLVQVREAATLGPPREIAALSIPLTALVLSPDGNVLLGGDRRGNILLWDTKTWLETNLTALRLKNTSATVLAFSSDGKYLIVGTADGQLGLWDFPNRRQVARAFLENGPIAAASFDPRGKSLAAVSRIRSVIHLFAVPSLQMQATWDETPGFITYLAFSPDGQALLSATPAEAAAGRVELRIWDVASGRCQAVFPDFAGPILFAPDGKSFLSLDRSRQIRLWPFEHSQVTEHGANGTQ